MQQIFEFVLHHQVPIAIATVAVVAIAVIIDRKWPELRLRFFLISCAWIAGSQKKRSLWLKKLNAISTRKTLERIRLETIALEQQRSRDETHAHIKAAQERKEIEAKERRDLNISIKKADRRRFKQHFGFFPEELRRGRLIKMNRMLEIHAKFIVVGKEAHRIACMKPSPSQQTQYANKAAEYTDMMKLTEEFIRDYSAPHWSELQERLSTMKELSQFAGETPIEPNKKARSPSSAKKPSSRKKT